MFIVLVILSQYTKLQTNRKRGLSMFGAVMRMERKKENHGRSPTQLRKYEKQSTGLSFNNVQPRYNLDLSARSDVLTYTKENQIKISSGKGVAIIQRMRNNVVQRCDPSGFMQQQSTTACDATQDSGGYLDEPAKKDGVLVIGAGSNPKEGAYNIDINPTAEGVHYGDATNLSNVGSNSQQRIIIENPYGYDPLNSAVLRVLQDDGVIEITGADANRYVNKTRKKAEEVGLTIVETETINDTSGFTTSLGEPLRSEHLTKYTLRKI